MTEKLLYEELTHKIIGCSHAVFKALGYGHREKVYQRALAEEFKMQEVKFKQELAVPIYYNDKIIARYYLDFFVQDKVVVEI